jgi:hypothetical protein
MRRWLSPYNAKPPPTDPRLRGMLANIHEDPEVFLSRNWPDLTKKERARLSRELTDFRKGITGSPVGRPRAFLWQLVASGIADYAGSEHIAEDPAQNAIAIAACALWPIVLAPKLKDGWYEALRSMSSEEIARLVAEARLANRFNGELGAEQFARFLTATPFARGTMALLDEMSDSRRGGASLTAMAMAQGKRPPSHLTPQSIVAWVALAAGAGIVGSRADYLATHAWDWLEGQAGEALSGHSESSHGSGSDDWFGSGSRQSSAHEGLLRVIEDLFIHH